jgi:hypothetical protein
MFTYLNSVFTVVLAALPGTTAILGNPAAVAEAMTAQAFADADVDKDGRLSRTEFAAWLLGANNRLTEGAAAVPVPGSAAQATTIQHRHSVDDLRVVTRLGFVSYGHVLDTFGENY